METVSLCDWGRNESAPFPMSPVASRDRDASVLEWIRKDRNLDPTLIALMWLRFGRFEPSHELVQNATRGLAAYTHGMLHRLEGDYWNAKYWFRQVRDPSLMTAIQGFLERNRAPKPWDRFDPSAFVDAVEGWHQEARQAGRTVGAEIPQVARWEWEAVWEYASNSLS